MLVPDSCIACRSGPFNQGGTRPPRQGLAMGMMMRCLRAPESGAKKRMAATLQYSGRRASKLTAATWIVEAWFSKLQTPRRQMN
jgi:hypothetical protein